MILEAMMSLKYILLGDWINDNYFYEYSCSWKIEVEKKFLLLRSKWCETRRAFIIIIES